MQLLSKNDYESLQNWIKNLKEFQLDSMFDTNVLARAYLYTNSISIYKNSENSICGEVGDGKYQVQISSEDNSILGECSCPYDGKCKHLAALVLKMIE